MRTRLADYLLAELRLENVFDKRLSGLVAQLIHDLGHAPGHDVEYLVWLRLAGHANHGHEEIDLQRKSERT